MKLNNLNKFYIVVSIILIAASVYRTMTFKSWERYNYTALMTAPETFPVHVREAYFLLPDDDFVSIDDEAVNRFNSSWGAPYSSSSDHHLQRLPEKLVLKYFSYRENQFYSDTISLPADEILTIFKTAERRKQFFELNSYGGPQMGLDFIIGLANNGNVIVWLRGIYLERELLRIQLKPAEPESDDMYFHKPLTKDQYLIHAFEGLSDSLRQVYRNGFERNANYIDTLSRYIEKNADLWKYQQEKGIIDFKKEDRK